MKNFEQNQNRVFSPVAIVSCDVVARFFGNISLKFSWTKYQESFNYEILPILLSGGERL